MRYVTTRFLDNAALLACSRGIKTILDIGCGEGFFASRLGNEMMIELDISIPSLKIAKLSNPMMQCIAGDISHLPFKSASFDLVIAMEVLEHLNDPEKAIMEVRAISRKYCLFSVPNDPFFKTMNLFRGKNLRLFGNDPKHVQSWNEKRFLKLISKYFDVLEIRKPFPWIMVMCEKR